MEGKENKQFTYLHLIFIVIILLIHSIFTFFRTSNGKSTVINAMLHSKVLPQGMGHTTCCFLQVEGGSENDKCFKLENSEEKLPIKDLDSVGHALSDGNSKLKSMGQDSLLRIFYPKAGSKLLQNDVVIVDR